MEFPQNTKWYDLLKEEFHKTYYQDLLKKIYKEKNQGKIIYPATDDVFNAFRFTDYDQVKVVLLGQDPYHGDGEAHGLLFSVKKGVRIPPSLRNIYKELASDIGFRIPTDGYLKNWADAGVFLLNTILTVEKDQALSHKNWGWEIFTDQVIRILNAREKPLVFALWGNFAKSKEALITNPQHFVLKANHPSPLSASRGFFGCKHFSKINSILKTIGEKENGKRIKT